MPLTWKVKIFEARPLESYRASGVPADFRDTFGVLADGPDDAKRAAKKWLADRGDVVRSVNVIAGEDRSLVAYVATRQKTGSK